MKLQDIMTRDVAVARPGDTVQSVASKMDELGIGSLPVCDGKRLLGMVTDRDLAVRVLAKGKGVDTPVTEVMSSDVEYCFEDDDLSDVENKMAGKQIRRLPIVDRDKQLVGIVALGDVAKADKDKRSGDTLEKISQNGANN
ncbi:MAG: CBS domain-containing protein [Caulobacteraceae bacterium]